MVIGRHRFQSVFKPPENKKPKFSNSSGLKSVFKEHRFLDGLVWTADLTVEIKMRFKISRRGVPATQVAFYASVAISINNRWELGLKVNQSMENQLISH